jgi:GntR family transcriptional regulator
MNGRARVPAYVQIANTLSERISQGVYVPGGRLPSEAELCQEFGVSPMTARRGLTILADQRLISGERGRGTFVRSIDLGDSTFKLDPLGGEWLDQSAEVKLLSGAPTRANEHVARMLRIAPGDRVIYLRRLVLNNGTPAMYHTEHIVYDPRRPLVESQLQLTSLHGLLESARGQRFPRGVLTLRAACLDAEAADALNQPLGALALSLEHVFQDVNRRPVSWGRFLLRGDLFQLQARMGPD